MLLLMLPGFTVKLNACVVPFGATFVIFRRPLPGFKMQSNGLLFPVLPSDG
jgi:hypothetical protein